MNDHSAQDVLSLRLSSGALERAVRMSRESGDRLGTVVTRLGLISEQELAQLFAETLGISQIHLGDMPLTRVLDGVIASRFLKDSRVIPTGIRPEGIAVAMADPTDQDTLRAIEFATERNVIAQVACSTDVEAAWERLYGRGHTDAERPDSEALIDDQGLDDVDRLKDLASEAPVIRFVNQLIGRAVELRASDIHVEPMIGRLAVRLRIDGVLHDVDGPPEALRSAVISRIKVMAKLNIAERRLAQDGRVRMTVRGTSIDLRVATAPTIHGESIVLRLLERNGATRDFQSLGFDAPLERLWTDVLKEPHGIVLVTGPTGSGKTTTLYASLETLNTPDRKILTVEDPVEYQIDGINQVQVKPQIGLTFSSALRSFLRHDPDIMMIGEIRDLETAQIAVQSALTGHLILSTLHTNDAASAVTRLLDMGIEDYLLTSTLLAVAGQRLVRRLCKHCRQPYAPLPELVAKLGLGVNEIVTLYAAVGCQECDDTGFRGRTTIFELLVMSDEISHLILQKSEAKAIRRQAVLEGMRTMLADGIAKAIMGATTIEEVFRATREG